MCPHVSAHAGEEGPEAATRHRSRPGPQRRVPRPRIPQAGQHDPRPDQVSLLLHLRCFQISLAIVEIVDLLLLCFLLDSDVGRLRRNLVRTTAIMRGFWVLLACYPRCVLCLWSIDAL